VSRTQQPPTLEVVVHTEIRNLNEPSNSLRFTVRSEVQVATLAEVAALLTRFEEALTQFQALHTR
jgi:Cu/Ag efflux protein CusF